MATVNLKKIKKVYPNTGEKKRRRDRKAGSTVQTSGVEVTEQGVVAVQEFDLDIADQEFVVLVGPSGCGKSTTLRMIAGLEEITGGELYIDGQLMNDVPAKDRDIAMVFQSYALYPHMTVYDNMAFSLKMKKVPKAEIDQRVREAAEILDITQYLRRKPKALSGGQRQRVAIGRAIVRNPKVFLMDEPLSNLDAKLRNQMRAEIIKLRSKIHTTFVYVTHDQTEAMTLGDRIVVMKDGWIMQIGTPQEVFDHPANLFVAGFIGSPQMNFFSGRLEREGNRYWVSLFGTAIPLPEEKQAALLARDTPARDITAGIRPEHITLGGPGAAGALEGTVDVSELMGSTVHLHVRIQDRDAVVVLPTLKLSSPANHAFSLGAKIFLSVQGDVLHLFDPDSGENLLP